MLARALSGRGVSIEIADDQVSCGATAETSSSSRSAARLSRTGRFAAMAADPGRLLERLEVGGRGCMSMFSWKRLLPRLEAGGCG